MIESIFLILLYIYLFFLFFKIQIMLTNKIFTSIRDSSKVLKNKNIFFSFLIKHCAFLKQLKNWVIHKVLPDNAVNNDESIQLDTFPDLTRNRDANQDLKKEDFNKRKTELIINPNNKKFNYWLIIFTICYIYNLIFLVARSVFWELQEIDPKYIWFIFDYGISDLVYLADILIQFRTSICFYLSFQK